MDHFLNTTNPVIDHPVAAGLRNRQNRVPEGKMKDTVIDDAESVVSEEEVELMSSCCSARIDATEEGEMARCGSCDEWATAVVADEGLGEESTLDPLAELRKLSGISEAPVGIISAAPELETALWAELDQAYSDVSSSEEVDIEGFAEYMLEGQISEMLRTQIEATFAGEEVNTTSPLGEWIRREVEEIREQQMRDDEDSSDEDSNIMYYVMSLLTSSAEDWTDHTASKANESVDTDLDGAIEAAGGDVNSPEAKEIKDRFGK